MHPLAVDTVAWRSTDGIDFMTWPAFDDLDVDVVMTTRHGGVSAGAYGSLNLGLHVADDDELVVENRRRAARTIGASLEDLVFCNQTHGSGVLVVTESDRGRGTESLQSAIDGVDAVVTTDVGPVLVMMVADCVPMALYAPATHIAAAVHSGWRGTVGRVAGAAVEAMVALGASPDDIVAAIGPAVDPDQYQVGPEVMEAASECFGGDTDDVLRPDDGEGAGTGLFDLWAANRRILVEAGVRPEHIHVAGVPSGGDGPFFSDRGARPCGRNAILVRLRPRP
jgi:YfiH family protein